MNKVHTEHEDTNKANALSAELHKKYPTCGFDFVSFIPSSEKGISVTAQMLMSDRINLTSREITEGALTVKTKCLYLKLIDFCQERIRSFEAISPAPPLRDMRETVSKECDECAVNDSCNRDRHFQGECSTIIPKASDYVATESEKKETVLCTKCGENPANHNVTLSGRAEEICCQCYVGGGGLPADWHTGCMEAKKRKDETPEKQEVPEEKTVHVHSLQELNQYVKELFGRVEKLEHPKFVVPLISYDMRSFPEMVVDMMKQVKVGETVEVTAEENENLKPDTVKQEATGILRSVSNPLCHTCRKPCKLKLFECEKYQCKSFDQLCTECTRACKGAILCEGFTNGIMIEPKREDTVKQEEGQPCLLEKCQWYRSKDDICGANIGHDCIRIKPQSKPESEANMDFSEALKALKMGNKVKRVGWKKGNYIFIENEIFLTGYADTDKQFVWKPDHNDLLATDWMLHIE